MPHQLVLSLLPAELQRHPGLAEIDQLESAPISSVHLWFDRPITQLPHAVFIDRLSQWMFNRSLLGSQNPTEFERPNLSQTDVDHAFYYQIVISASRELAQCSREEAIARIVQELTDVWPETARAKLVHSRLISEHNAVFSVMPGAERLRPPQQTPIRNLQLAGDWTRTGWPATMEGAVRSGYLAAENVLAQLNRPEKLLQPDLAAGLLSKILIGL